MKEVCPYCGSAWAIKFGGGTPQADYHCGTIVYASHHLIDKRGRKCLAAEKEKK